MSKVFIIAEAGVNHNGKFGLAMKLVDAAKESGADAVKFQTFRAEKLVSRSAPKAEYQQETTGAEESQFEMLRALELSDRDFESLAGHCREIGIEFMSTAFDLDSIAFLSGLGISRWKIPSGEITNLPYLRKVACLGEPVILSTGMSTLGEIEAALEVFRPDQGNAGSVTLLHCTTEYPAPLAEVNLRAMRTLGDAFGLPVGYSDHTEGIAIPIAAVALGAKVIEKHFTIDRGMPGPDHRASLEPEELAAMVASIRDVETALGSSIKRPTGAEVRNKSVARKSIVASREIQAGEAFSEENLAAKRPGTGISPMEWDRILGRTARRHYAPDEAIEW